MHLTKTLRFTLCVFASALALVQAPFAAAQGTEGFVADPLTSAEFDALVERMELDFAQRIRAEALHEEYKVRFMALREHEIESLVRTMHEMQMKMQTAMPGRRDIEQFLRERAAVVARIEAVDRDLFFALAEVVDEDQQGALARARRQRERDTYTGDAVEDPFMGSSVDLVDVLFAMEDLTDEAWAAIDPVVIDYEMSSNTALRALHDKTMDMYVAMFEVLEELGLENFTPDFSDQEKMEEMGRMMQEAMQRVSADVQGAAKRVLAINNQARTTIGRLLPEDLQPRFEEEYLRRAYPGVFHDWDSPEHLLKAALEMDDLTADERQQIESIQSSWQVSYKTIQQKLIAIEDERRESMGEQFDMTGESWQQHWEKQQEITMERSALNQKAREEALKVLGEERAVRVAQMPRDMMSAENLAMEVGAAVAEAAVEEMLDVESADGISVTLAERGGDPLLPAAMSLTEFRGYLDRLGAAPDQRILAEDFHQTYREAFDRFHEDVIQPQVVEAQQRLWERGLGADRASVKAVVDARREAMEHVLALEEELFLDLELVLTPEQNEAMPDIRTARSCRVYDVGEAGWMGMQRDWVDLMRLILDLRLEPAEMQALHRTLAEYEAEALPILRELYDNLAKMQMAQAEAIASLQQRAQGEQSQEMWQEYGRLMEPFQKRSQQLNEQRSEVERSAKDAIDAALPPARAAEFEKRYNRFSYPEIFPDRGDAQPAITRAFELPDLTATQVEAIALIEQDHLDRYDALCDEMMAISDSSNTNFPQFADGEFDMDAMVEWQRRHARLELLKHQRTEWNATTTRKIRAALREEQAEKVFE